jgi:hypothetical protein
VRKVICVVGFLLVACGQTSQEEIFKKEVETAILLDLKDPDSAQFRYGPYDIFPELKLACGEVNSKNSFGGYTGFQRFVFDNGSIAFQEGDTDVFVSQLNKCTDAVKRQTEQTLNNLDKTDPEAAAKLRTENEQTGETKK